MNFRNTKSNINDQVSSNSGLNVLLINASSRTADSVTRYLTQKVVDQLEQSASIRKLMVRDVAEMSLPFIKESWVEANFTAPEQRNEKHHKELALSDALVDELKLADVIVMGVPIYNFSVPAALKAWIDLVARAGVTFRYTSEGPKGLLEGKQAIVAVASGGVEIDSAIDFTTPYLRHVLGFIGIQDVKIIEAERLNINAEESRKRAELQVDQAVSKIKKQMSVAA